jgi:hypothetical protein
LTHPKDDDLPPEVAELFSHDGEWSTSRDDLFYFTCDCTNRALCKLTRTEDEDRWVSHCSTKECEFHGEHEVITVEVEGDEHKRRVARAKEFEADREAPSWISEIEHFLGVAAMLDAKDTDEAAMLDSITEIIRKYVFIGREEAIILTLWVVHTWCLEAARFTPYIHLRSAMPREGKSRVLDVLGYLAARTIRMSDPTPAAIADSITVAAMFGSEAPTFLWDEIDSAYERWGALREYVNNGFERGNPIIRAGGKVKLTFAPKVMAGLTELPLTVKDRSFRFDMARATEEEKPLRLTPRERRSLERRGIELRTQIGAFAQRHMEALMEAEPELPDALDDRGQDIAEPLLAIADVAGGDWAEKSRGAMVKIRLAMQKTDSASDHELLLSDIHEIFGKVRPRIYSEDLIEKLLKREESPWASMRLTTHKLGRMLHQFSEYPGGPRIGSQRMRIGKGPQRRGYTRKQFEDAWKRYLGR